MDALNNLVNIYKVYNARIIIENDNKIIEIPNPYWNENIKICFTNNEYTFYFSYQHAHFDDSVDDLIEYIDEFLKSDMIVIEFFKEGESQFGGSRYYSDLDISSGDKILKNFCDDNKKLYKNLFKRLKGHKCKCAIRGWNSILNHDINFIL